jgi:hypothetical protein
MIRLILGISLFGTVAILQLAPMAFASSSRLSSAVMKPPTKAVNVLFQEAFSVSRELSLQCAHQGKRVLPLACDFDPYSSREKTPLGQGAVAQTRPFPPFFSPLKVSPPPNSEGDPFLS